MNTLFLSASVWLRDRERCESLVERIVDTNPERAEVLVLDAATIQREGTDRPRNQSFRIIEIDFRTWVNETLTEGGVVNIEVIRRAALEMASGGVFAINAIGFDSSTIVRALNQLRLGFYPLPEWPRALMLIGDDFQMHQISPALAHAFYLRPSVLTRTTMNKMLRQISHEARVLRLFGRPAGFAMRLATRALNALFARGTRKIEKQQAWLFEK